LGTSCVGLGTNDRGLGADERRFGTLPSGDRTFDRALTDGLTVGGYRLGAGGQFERDPRQIERILLAVPPLLASIQSLLTDISRHLLAVDASLTIIQGDTGLPVPHRWILATLFVVLELLSVDAKLIPVADELLAIGDRLLELGQTLFLGQLAGAG
jgi:hypothetical protein